MSRSYREMAHTMSYVDMREHIPEWAQGYAVGDEIWLNHPDEGPTLTTVCGFSSNEDHPGLPVIDGSEFPEFGSDSLYLRKQNVLSPSDVAEEFVD